MSVRTLDKIAAEACEAAVTVAWRQWAALGSMASSGKRARSMVDPEALILLSLALRDHEPRLSDVIHQWIVHGVRLLSVQRTKNLASGYSPDARRALAEFAALARREGGDARWKTKFFGAPDQSLPSRDKKSDMNLDFVEAAALMVRLRRGLGVNVRTDVLAYLLGQRGKWVTVRVMAHALHYTEVAIRRAAGDLAGARLIHATVDDQPTTYFVEPTAWADVLELGPAPPAWRHWHEIFALIVDLDVWARTSNDQKISDYAMDTLGRDLVKRHRAAFVRNEIPLSTRQGLPTDPFDELITRMTSWVVDVA